jgi:hypothetical protein
MLPKTQFENTLLVVLQRFQNSTGRSPVYQILVVLQFNTAGRSPAYNMLVVLQRITIPVVLRFITYWSFSSKTLPVVLRFITMLVVLQRIKSYRSFSGLSQVVKRFCKQFV